MMRLARVAAVLFFAGAAICAAQTTVTQVKPDPNTPPDVKVDCPMQIDVPMGVEGKKSAFIDMKVEQGWQRRGMANYVCHTERISQVYAKKTKEKKNKLEFEVNVTAKSEQYRQDVDLTVSVLDLAGKPLCSKIWRSLTIGKDHSGYVPWVAMASETKTLSLECAVEREKFAAMFSDTATPTIRVIVAPKIED